MDAGRKVDTARWQSMFEAVGLPMHDAAEAFLQEFGGLTVNQLLLPRHHRRWSIRPRPGPPELPSPRSRSAVRTTARSDVIPGGTAT
ncbi:hypothetical protein [Streptomyces sp. NPDC085479]|uniref:hypothetical protein n=1 Tax=Streptomyces sp. NPDC085479 TaxID=3365726 RepID=UPI0037CD2A93